MNISEHKSSDKNRCTFNLKEILTSHSKLKLKINGVIITNNLGVDGMGNNNNIIIIYS